MLEIFPVTSGHCAKGQMGVLVGSDDAAVQMEGRAAARSKRSGDRDLRGPERSSHRSAIEGTAISSVVAKVVQALKIADDLKLSRAGHQSDLPSFPPCFRARKGFQKGMSYLFLGPTQIFVSWPYTTAQDARSPHTQYQVPTIFVFQRFLFCPP